MRYRTWHQISENLLHILVTFLTRFCWVYQNLLGNLLESYWIWHKKEDQSGDIPYITRNSGTKKKINLVTSDIPSPPPSHTNTHIYGRRGNTVHLNSNAQWTECPMTKCPMDWMPTVTECPIFLMPNNRMPNSPEPYGLNAQWIECTMTK